MATEANKPKDPAAEAAPEAEVYEGIGHHSLMEIFETPTFREMVRLVLNGLKQPKDSGEYKYAMLQVQRLLAPVSAIVVPLIAVVILMVSTAMGPPVVQYETKVIQPEPVKEDLEKIEEIIEKVEPPEPMEFSEAMDVPGNSDIPTPTTGVTSEKFSAQVAEMDAVQMVKSPVVMKGIYSSRNPGQRGTALASYGGGGATEGAVIRALRWLKKVQETDGSWNGTSGGGTYNSACAPAMTGLALLTYLAHGETPASEEFGPTVERAIKWMMSAQDASGRFRGSDGNEYSLPIAAYAMCEAYAMTKIPMVKEAAEKAIEIIIQGQHPDGGWDYRCAQTARNDTSVMAWCVQAIKAAKMAGLSNPGLEKAYRNAAGGLRTNGGPSGGFGYTDRNATGLTGAGVLGLQLLGAGKDGDVRASLTWLSGNASCNWMQPWGANPLYYWYYTTQANFHAGEPFWKKWNDAFSRELVRNQTVMKGASEDGKDIGYWVAPSKGEHAGASLVYNTTLCTLMLEVYYRYLPTYKPPEDVTQDDANLGNKKDDVNVDITF